MLSMQPIGYVRSPYTNTEAIPKGLGAKHEAEGTLEILAEFERGLMDIEGFSHLFVIWAFDRSEGFNLEAKPPTDDRPHGVFATRSPRRPNPIGLTVVELLGREGPALRVRGIDMLDGTPILDIKPYLTSVPPERLRRGWLAEAEARTVASPLQTGLPEATQLLDHFRMLARYNRIANERLYEACAQLDDVEYRRERRGSFGSIHALLNHILLGDRIWMARFEGSAKTTPPLHTILFDAFAELRKARTAQDESIEGFFAAADAGFVNRPLAYTNSRGKAYVDQPAMAVSHFFNHQTHHRGQIHVMLSETSVAPPSLDLHRIVNP